MNKFIEISIILSLSLLFLSGSLYTTENWSVLQPYMLIFSMLLLVLIAVVFRIKVVRTDKKLLIYFTLFTLSSIISSMINKQKDLFVGSIVLLFVYIGLACLMPSIMNINEVNYRGKNNISIALLITHIPIIIIPIISDGVSYKSYRGIFYNPNSFGTIVATVFALVFAKVIYYIEMFIKKKVFKKKDFILFVLLSAIMFVLTIFSSSRTSFIGVISLIIISIILITIDIVLNKQLKVKEIRKLYILFLILVIIGAIIYNVFPIKEILYEGIFNKFSMKSDDVFDGRSYIWLSTIKDARFWGWGRGYFSQLGLGAHSTFISILGQYGVIALLFFVLFLFTLLLKSLKYIRKSRSDKYKYLPLFSTTLFIVLSMGEGMMLKTSMLLMLTNVGFMSLSEQYNVDNIIK